MTAATEVDLEAWMQGEIEVPCTMKWPPFGRVCEKAADHVAYVRCRPCDQTRQVFVCAGCRWWLTSNLTKCSRCLNGSEMVTVTWIERIKR